MANPMETHSRSASQQPYGQPAPAYMPNASPLPQYAQPMGGQPQYAQPPNQYGQSYQQPPQNAYQTNYAPPPQPPPSNQQGQGFFPQQAPTQGAVNIQLNMAAPTKEPQAQPRQIATGNECSHICLGMVLAMFCPGIFTFIMFCTPIEPFDPYSKYYKMLGSAIFYLVESVIFTIVYSTFSCYYYTYSYGYGYYYYYDYGCLSAESAMLALSSIFWIFFVISIVSARIYYWQAHAAVNRVLAY